MINSLALPIRALVFTLAGVLLASGWYQWNRLILIIVVPAVLVGLVLVQVYAKSRSEAIRSAP
jgi:membrane protein DedA with SNARE-associated domain